jgi:hypothetical protein
MVMDTFALVRSLDPLLKKEELGKEKATVSEKWKGSLTL